MVEAGADQVPEETILEALELAHAEIRRICEALEDLREQVGKPKWVDTELTAELGAQHGDAVRAAIAEARPPRGGRVVDELVAEAPRDHDGLDRGRHGQPDAGPGELRGDPREGAHRGGRGPAARAVPRRAAGADRRRAGLEGAPLGEARPALRPDPRGRRSFRSRSALRRPRASRRSRTRSRSSSSSARPRLRSTRTSSARRSRSRSVAPTAAPRRRSGRSSAR